MKQRNKLKLLNRLNHAIADMYHNATPKRPSVSDSLFEEYLHQFEFWASAEIDYIHQGFGLSDKELKNPSPSTTSFDYKAQLLYWLTQNYGELVCEGRGGRTVCPSRLEPTRVWQLEKYPLEINMEEATRLTLAVEALNEYVKLWNSESNLTDLWRQWCDSQAAAYEDIINETKHNIKVLIVEIRQLKGVGNQVCSILKQTLKKYHDRYKQSLKHKRLYVAELV